MINVNKLILSVILMLLPIFLNAQQDEPSIPKGTINKIPVSSYNPLEGKQLLKVIYEKDFTLGADNWEVFGNWNTKSSTSSLLKSNSLIVSNSVNGAYKNNAKDEFISPAISLPTAENNEKIYLSITEAFEIESGYDKGLIKISKDNGLTWQTIWARDGYSELRESNINITRFAGNDIKLKFEFISDNTENFKGWVVEKVSVSVFMEPQSLNVSMVSLNSQNFPFIYSNVVIDDGSSSLPSLTRSNFQVFENNILQTDYFQVTPPTQGGGSRIVDIVICMDISGSMDEEIQAVSDNLEAFVLSLDQQGFQQYGLGLVIMNATDPIVINNGQLIFNDAQKFLTDVWKGIPGIYDYAGSYKNDEYGYDALVKASNSFNFVASQKVMILITDEGVYNGGHSNLGNYDISETISLMNQNNINVFSLIDEKVPNVVQEYGEVSVQTNGAWFNINSSFDDILTAISQTISDTYLLRYKSNNPNFDGVQRDVEVRVNYNGEQASDFGQYTPGSAPTITRTNSTIALHQQAWADGTSFDIEVEAVDNISPGVQSVTLYYKNTNDVSYKSIQMSNTSGDLYSATIPGGDVQTPGVDYYITATDGISTSSDPTNSNNQGSNPKYQIAILPNVAPSIVHTPITSLAVGSNITINATVIDNTNSLAEVNLYYRKIGQLTYTKVVMLNSSGDNYSGTIPGSAVTNDGIEYYIYAYDDFGVGNYSGTADYPHRIEGAVDYSRYLTEKLALIDKILKIKAVTNTLAPLGYNLGRKTSYFGEVEENANNFVKQLVTDNSLGLANQTELEAVARLVLSERILLQGIQDAIEISEYGASGLRALGTSFLMNAAMKKLVKTVSATKALKFLKDPLNDMSKKSNNSINKLVHIFLTKMNNGAKFLDKVTQNNAQILTEKAFTEARNEISMLLLEEFDEHISTDIFDHTDNIIQELVFMKVFETLSMNKQKDALSNAMSSSFPHNKFNEAQADATRTLHKMISANNNAKNSANYFHTLGEIGSWAVIAGAIVGLIIAIIVTATGVGAPVGIPLIIATIATLSIKMGSVLSTTGSIAESSVAFIHTDLVLPFKYLNPSTNESFSHKNLSLVDNLNSGYIVEKASNKIKLQKNNTQSTLNYFYRLQDKINSENNGWVRMITDSIDYYYGRRKETEEIITADLSPIRNEQFLDSLKAERFNKYRYNYFIKSAASDLYYSNLKLFAEAQNNNIDISTIYEHLQASIKSIIEDIEYMGEISDDAYTLLDEENISIPTSVGIKEINFDIISKERLEARMLVALHNYGTEQAADIIVTPYFVDERSSIIGENWKVISLKPKETKVLDFLVDSEANKLTGAILIEPSDSLANYITLPSVSFNLNFEELSPDVKGVLSNNNVYSFPNPFNPSQNETTTFRFLLENDGSVDIRIYDVSNNLVKRINLGEQRSGIQLSVVWDGKDNNGNIVSNGVYFYVIESSTGERAVGKIAVLK